MSRTVCSYCFGLLDDGHMGECRCRRIRRGTPSESVERLKDMLRRRVRTWPDDPDTLCDH